MEPSTNQPVHVFFDFRSFLYGLRSRDLNIEIDYRMLADWLAQEAGKRSGEVSAGCEVRVYAAVRFRGTTVFEGGVERFLNGLERETDFRVFRLPWRNLSRECPDCGATYPIYEEERVDTSIVADMVAMAACGEYRTAVLVSGDSDFIPAIEKTIHQFGVKVYVASWGRGHGLSGELAALANDHFDLMNGVNTFATARPTEVTADQEEVFLEELRAAQEFFVDGYVGERHFVRFWRGGSRFPASVRVRTEILERLVAAGRVERYMVVQGTATRQAIRIVAAPAGSDPALPPTPATERPPP